MIRTLIIDDEPLARRRLLRLLSPIPDLQVVAEAENGAEAVLKIEQHRPDLLMLDVQMPDLDGFGVLKMLELDELPLVIFVTAYDQYAVDAFTVSAVDYLLKPIRRPRLEQALTKAREKLSSRRMAGAELNRFLEKLGGPPGAFLRRLPVRVKNRLLIVTVDQITSLRIDRGLVYVTTPEGEFWTKYTTFTDLENQIDPKIFQRVHRQVIVNLNHIREVITHDNHTASLRLTGGHQVSVSRQHMKQLRAVLDL